MLTQRRKPQSTSLRGQGDSDPGSWQPRATAARPARNSLLVALHPA